MPLNLDGIFDSREILKARHRISSLVYRTPLLHEVDTKTGTERVGVDPNLIHR